MARWTWTRALASALAITAAAANITTISVFNAASVDATVRLRVGELTSPHFAYGDLVVLGLELQSLSRAVMERRSVAGYFSSFRVVFCLLQGWAFGPQGHIATT